LLQEYFAFRELALIDALNLSEAGFFFGGERSGGWFRFSQSFHREFVSAFHEATVTMKNEKYTENIK